MGQGLDMDTTENTTPIPAETPESYGDALARGQRAEAEGRLVEALEAYDHAIHRRRVAKKSPADACEVYKRVEAHILAQAVAYDIATDGLEIDQLAARVEQHARGLALAHHAIGETRDLVAKVFEATHPTTEEDAVKKTKSQKKPQAERKDSGALAKTETDRAKKAGLKFGAELTHKFPDGRTVTCRYVGERDWRYRSAKYTSNSAAANAAAADAAQKSASLNGWYFWGIEKRS